MDKQYCYGKASSLIESVEKNIGFDQESGLIKDGSPEGVFLDTFENSSLAIAYILQGRKEEANKILIGIKKIIGIDKKTGLFYNKKGLSKDESKKVLPGENIIYLSNQALISTLLWLLKNKKESEELSKIYEKEIGFFEYENQGKKYKLFKHAVNQNYFYPFNNILVAINKQIMGKSEEAKKYVLDIIELCFDSMTGLLKTKPQENVYFTLNNALYSTYLCLIGEKDKATKIIKLIETNIGFDKKTGMAFEGFTQRKKIENALTYANSQLAISYLALAGMF